MVVTVLPYEAFAAALPQVSDHAVAPAAPPPVSRAVVINFTVTVSYEWQATQAQFAEMDRGWIGANALLFDISDGQMVYKSVDLWWNKNSWGGADVQVLNQSNYRARAIRCGLYNGGTVWLGRDSQGWSYDSGFGHATIVHEWGHYGICLPDEYTDSGGSNEPGICIMSDGVTSEMCTNANHVTGVSNQEPKSCWQQAKDLLGAQGLVMPVGAANPGPTGAPAPKITWHYPDVQIDKVTGIEATKTDAREGDTVTVTGHFTNAEGLLRETLDYVLYDGNPDFNGKELARQSIYTAGWLIDVQFPYTVLAGDHTLYMRADPDNRREELSETNNTASIVIHGRSKPTVKANFPKTMSGTEDTPLETDLSLYEADVEDSGAALLWKVQSFDATRLGAATILSNGDTLHLEPKADWFGTTQVGVRLTDSDQLTADAWTNVTFASVNDLPKITTFNANILSLLRGESSPVELIPTDIETSPDKITPVIEYRPANGPAWWPMSATWEADRFKSTFHPDYPDPLGSYDLRAMVTDADGGASETSYLNASVSVANNPPVATDLLVDPELVLRGGSVDLTLNLHDLETKPADMKVEFEVSPAGEEDWSSVGDPPREGTNDTVPAWDFGSNGWTLSQPVGTDWLLGAYDVRGRAVDPDGGTSTWVESLESFSVANVLPKVTEVTPQHADVLRGTKLNITIVGSDLETPTADLALTIQYHVGKGAWKKDSLSRPSFDSKKSSWRVVYTPALDADLSTITFRAQFVDKDKGESDWLESGKVEVTNNPPVAGAVIPPKGRAGIPASFDAGSSTDKETTAAALRYEWNFGDRSAPGTGAKAKHTYAKAGTYTVTVKVTDGDAAVSQKTGTIRVAPADVIGTTGSGSGLLIGGIVAAMIAVVVVVGLLLLRRRSSGGGSLF